MNMAATHNFWVVLCVYMNALGTYSNVNPQLLFVIEQVVVHHL